MDKYRCGVFCFDSNNLLAITCKTHVVFTTLLDIIATFKPKAGEGKGGRNNDVFLLLVQQITSYKDQLVLSFFLLFSSFLLLLLSVILYN